MRYRYRAAERFWTHFHRLNPTQKDAARKAWRIFKEDPFDLRLRPHKIQRLSAVYGRVIHAVELAADLRVVFFIEGDPSGRWTSARTTFTKVSHLPAPDRLCRRRRQRVLEMRLANMPNRPNWRWRRRFAGERR